MLELRSQTWQYEQSTAEESGGRQQGSEDRGDLDMPSEIGVSLGTAVALGLANCALGGGLSTAHLILRGKCRYDCAYCTRGRASTSRDTMLSRINWPLYNLGSVLQELKNTDRFSRICIQAVNREGWFKEIVEIVEALRERVAVPVSVSLRPEIGTEVQTLLELGVDKVAIPLDSAHRDSYCEYREADYDETIEMILRLSDCHPGKIATHIIVGLGETDREAVEVIRRFVSAGVEVGLFAFTPCPGTRLEAEHQPEISRYRGIQVAHYLMKKNPQREFIFGKGGDLEGFGCSSDELVESVKPVAFQHAGCSGCTRPFFNERPSQEPYNYIDPPSGEETRRILRHFAVQASS